VSLKKNKKINELSQEEKLKFLSMICIIVGITAAPCDAEVFVFLSHLVERHGKRTREEIIKAIKMAASGDLECDIKHYNTMSIPYFEGIMRAYFQYEKIELHKYYQIKSEIEYKENKNSIEQKEKDKKAIKDTIRLIHKELHEFGKVKSIGTAYLEGISFNVLRNNGHIKINNEERIKYLKQAENILTIMEREKRIKTGHIKNIVEISLHKNDIDLKAKQLALRDYLMQCDNIDYVDNLNI
jgi:hypothetical protein